LLANNLFYYCDELLTHNTYNYKALSTQIGSSSVSLIINKLSDKHKTYSTNHNANGLLI